MADKALFDELVTHAKNQQLLDDTRPIRQANALAAIPSDPSTPQTGQAEAALRAGVDGITFGAGDSVKAGLNTALKMIKGESTDFAIEEAAERARTKLAAQEHPITSGIAGFAGSAATMAIPALRLAKTATVIGKTFQAAKVGSLVGGLSGIGHADGGLTDRAQASIAPATIGAVLGGGLGLAGAGVASVLDKRKAAIQIAKSLGNSPEAQEALNETFKKQGGLAAAGEWLAKQGYVKVGKPIQETAAHLERDLKSTGENIGGLLALADKASPNAVVDARGALEKISSNIQEVVKKNPGAASEIWAAAQAPMKNFLNELVFPSKGTSGVSLSTLQAFRTTLRDTYERGASEAVSKALQSVERSTADIIKTSLRKAAPKMADHLDDLNFKFSALSSADKAAKIGVKKAENLAANVTSNAIAYGVPSAAVGLMLGRPDAAIAGLAASAGTAALAPKLASTALPTAAAARLGAANAISPATQQSVSNTAQGGLRELFRQGNQ